MKSGITERGFSYYQFEDSYGDVCSLQQSSSIVPHIWLGVNDADPKIMATHAKEFGVETEETTGWVTYPIPEEVLLSTRMHLNVEQVKELIPYLQKFVEEGEL